MIPFPKWGNKHTRNLLKQANQIKHLQIKLRISKWKFEVAYFIQRSLIDLMIPTNQKKVFTTEKTLTINLKDCPP